MKLFWNKADTPDYWKIRVFDAILKTKLLYGLETMQLTIAEQNKLDAFQVKGLRRILQLPPTFIDRGCPNHFVYEMAEMQLDKPIKKFSQQWREAKRKL